MRKTLLITLLFAMVASIALAKGETGDRCKPASSYGKQDISAEACTAMLVDSAGHQQMDVVSAVPETTTITSEYTTADLTSAALDYTTAFGAKTRVIAVNMHADASITETMTIKLNSSVGANYDTTIVSESLVSEANVVWIPDGDFLLDASDELDVDITNANTTGNVYVEVIGETLQ